MRGKKQLQLLRKVIEATNMRTYVLIGKGRLQQVERAIVADGIMT